MKTLVKKISLALVISLTLTTFSAAAAGNSSSSQKQSGNSKGNSSSTQQSGSQQGGTQQGSQQQGSSQNQNSQSTSNNSQQDTQYVTRGEFMDMIVEMLGLTADVSSNFSDVASSDENYESIGIAKSLGIAKGNGKTFSSDSYITVAEAKIFLQRAIEALSSSSSDTIDLSDYFTASDSDQKSNQSKSTYATRDQLLEALQAIASAYDITADSSYSSEYKDNKNTDDKNTQGNSDFDGSSILYMADEDTAVTFNSSDFSRVFEDETEGTLDYVVFTLPDDDYGTLYYDYTSSSSYDSLVTASKAYYTDATPYLSDVAFVPDDDYTGEVSIDYTGYSEDAAYTYSGTVTIYVGTSSLNDGSSSKTNSVVYTTSKNTALTFAASDFSKVFEDNSDDDLDYVVFTLPDDDYGTLYYSYTSSSSYDSLVSASTLYYAEAAPYLSNVTFVPATDYTGVVTISYTAYGEDDDTYSGTVSIYVGNSGFNSTNTSSKTGTKSVSSSIRYTTIEDTQVTFNVADFNSACKNATGSAISYVVFSLPDDDYGTLYYDYTSSSDYGSTVSASTSYYKSSSPYLSKVSFVPYDDYTGTVTISYTGYNSSGTSFTGTISITVEAE